MRRKKKALVILDVMGFAYPDEFMTRLNDFLFAMHERGHVRAAEIVEQMIAVARDHDIVVLDEICLDQVQGTVRRRTANAAWFFADIAIGADVFVVCAQWPIGTGLRWYRPATPFDALRVLFPDICPK